MSEATTPLPPAGAIVSHPIADFETWKRAFDDHEPSRRAAGILAHHVHRAEDDPNLVTIYLALSDLGKGREFAESDDLRGAMAGAGVTAPPEITWIEPLHIAVDYRPLPAAMIQFDVADSAKWLESFVGNTDLRRSKGIIAEAAARLIDNPSRVLVYLQAETFDAIRSFRESPELQAAMKEAGVTSAPEGSYHNGVEAKAYD